MAAVAEPETRVSELCTRLGRSLEDGGTDTLLERAEACDEARELLESSNPKRKPRQSGLSLEKQVALFDALASVFVKARKLTRRRVGLADAQVSGRTQLQRASLQALVEVNIVEIVAVWGHDRESLGKLVEALVDGLETDPHLQRASSTAIVLCKLSAATPQTFARVLNDTTTRIERLTHRADDLDPTADRRRYAATIRLLATVAGAVPREYPQNPQLFRLVDEFEDPSDDGQLESSLRVLQAVNELAAQTDSKSDCVKLTASSVELDMGDIVLGTVYTADQSYYQKDTVNLIESHLGRLHFARHPNINVDYDTDNGPNWYGSKDVSDPDVAELWPVYLLFLITDSEMVRVPKHVRASLLSFIWTDRGVDTIGYNDRADAVRDLVIHERWTGLSERDIEYLLQLFTNDDPEVRNTAARAVGEIASGAPAEVRECALEALIGGDLLNDENADVRSTTAQTVGRIAEVAPAEVRECALEALVEGDLLIDEDADVRDTTVWAVGSAASRASTEIREDALVTVMERDPLNDEDADVRDTTVQTVGKIASEAPAEVRKCALEALIGGGLLNDENADVRGTTARAVEWIVSGAPAEIRKDALEALIEGDLLNDEDADVRGTTVDAVGEVALRAPPEICKDALEELPVLDLLADEDHRLRDRTTIALGKITSGQAAVGERALEEMPVADLLGDENLVDRATIIQAVWEITSEAPAAVGERALDELPKGSVVDLLADGDPDVRSSTVWFVKAIATGTPAAVDERTLEALVEVDVSDKPDLSRSKAIALRTIAQNCHELMSSGHLDPIGNNPKEIRNILGDLHRQKTPESVFLRCCSLVAQVPAGSRYLPQIVASINQFVTARSTEELRGTETEAELRQALQEWIRSPETDSQTKTKAMELLLKLPQTAPEARAEQTAD